MLVQAVEPAFELKQRASKQAAALRMALFGCETRPPFQFVPAPSLQGMCWHP